MFYLISHISRRCTFLWTRDSVLSPFYLTHVLVCQALNNTIGRGDSSKRGANWEEIIVVTERSQDLETWQSDNGCSLKNGTLKIRSSDTLGILRL